MGAGAALGAGLANGVGERRATQPGLGNRRPNAGHLPANRTPQQRRDALRDQLVGGERSGQLPERDWGQVRQDWQERRDQVRQDWQQYRDQARDDWQNWFDDHYRRYGGWYIGHAPGYWTRWDYLWDDYPVAAATGLTWWGVNYLGDLFGCADYWNPYYSSAQSIDYTEPVVTPALESDADSTSAQPPDASAEAVNNFDQARSAFLGGHYEDALNLTNAAEIRLQFDNWITAFAS
jgi:hypothetical protein